MPNLVDEADVLAALAAPEAGSGRQMVVLVGSAPEGFVAAFRARVEARGTTPTEIALDPTSASFEDVATEIAVAKRDVLVLLTGDESPAVFAWLVDKGVDFRAGSVFGWSGNVNDAMGKAFTAGAAYAPAVS